MSRSEERNPNVLFYDALENHRAEIAAFHLDRLLGFHRTPPVVGRRLNITHDIFRHANNNFLKNFFISKGMPYHAK